MTSVPKPTSSLNITFTPNTPKAKSPLLLRTFISNSHQDPKIPSPNISKSIKHKTHPIKPLIDPTAATNAFPTLPLKNNGNNITNNNRSSIHVGDRQILVLCGFGYWIQGFRCFPWLALNFYLVQSLNLHPSTLQLVQYSANLPMVAKPLYGIISDAVYFGDAHRVPYISFGVFLQILSWGTLALIPAVSETFPTQMACILLSNLGASITEVASDALVAEFSKKHKVGELQSFTLMALSAGGILGNLSGGLVLQRMQPKILFLTFSLLLTVQLVTSLATKEGSLDSPQSSDHHLVRRSVSASLSKQFSDLIIALSEERISRPLYWVVASIAIVLMLSGTTLCYQIQCLRLDPSTIGMSKVIGQMMVLSATVFYNRNLKAMPMRRLIHWLQITYALCILSDLFLVKQVNVRLGISNEAYVLCLSPLAEAVAQFKILPFSVLFANLCPQGCEGSLIAFSASALCLSSIFSGLLGVGLCYLFGISSEDYSSLPLAILVQFLAALLPLGWLSHIPISENVGKKWK